MSWLSNLWPQRKAITTLDLAQDLLSGAASNTGLRITWEKALQASAAFSCCRVIADGVAQVPLKLHRKLPGGGAELAEGHPWFDVVSAAPNPWTTSFEWRETAGLHLALMNRSYAYINRVGSAAGELLPLTPQQVRVERGDNFANRYFVTFGDKDTEREVAPDKILHLRGPSWNTWEGLDGVKLAREAIGLALATEEHGARLFKNGAIVGGILSTDAVLDKDQREALRASWDAAQTGLANAFKAAVLWGGMKWTPRAQQNDHAQWVEVRRLQIAEVCRFYRVLPIMIGEADRTATYASSEQMFLAHVVHTMGPWYKRLEQRLDLQLLTPQERKAGLFFRFNATGLLRGAHRDRAEYYRTLHAIGALNPNEIRDMEERNPYEGGDQYMQPLNMAPASVAPEDTAPPREEEKP